MAGTGGIYFYSIHWEVVCQVKRKRSRLNRSVTVKRQATVGKIIAGWKIQYYEPHKAGTCAVNMVKREDGCS